MNRTVVALSVAAGFLATLSAISLAAGGRGKAKDAEPLFLEGDQAQVLVTNCVVKGHGGKVTEVGTGTTVRVMQDVYKDKNYMAGGALVPVQVKVEGKTIVGWILTKNLRRIPKPEDASNTNKVAASDGAATNKALKKVILDQ